MGGGEWGAHEEEQGRQGATVAGVSMSGAS